MAVINLYSKSDCDAVLPKGEGLGELFNSCVRAVQETGYYKYHAGLQWSDLYQLLYPAAVISIVIIAICLVILVRRGRVPQ